MCYVEHRNAPFNPTGTESCRRGVLSHYNTDVQPLLELICQNRTRHAGCQCVRVLLFCGVLAFIGIYVEIPEIEQKLYEIPEIEQKTAGKIPRTQSRCFEGGVGILDGHL